MNCLKECLDAPCCRDGAFYFMDRNMADEWRNRGSNIRQLSSSPVIYAYDGKCTFQQGPGRGCQLKSDHRLAKIRPLDCDLLQAGSPECPNR